MNAPVFEPIARTLREAVLDYYSGRGEALTGRSGELTLATNSGLAERRGRPLLEMLGSWAGIDGITGMELVDLGCGFGALSAFFATQGARVTGVDINGSRFEVGRTAGERHALDLEFVTAPMQQVPLPDRRFDVAVMNNSLCYLTADDGRQAALAEARRILKPGGWLIVRNPNRLSLLDPFTGWPLLGLLSPETASRAAAALGRRRSSVRLISPPGAKAELVRAGFSRVAWLGVPGRGRPRVIELVARYQHVLGRRSDV